jgi:hypothetical protein
MTEAGLLRMPAAADLRHRGVVDLLRKTEVVDLPHAMACRRLDDSSCHHQGDCPCRTARTDHDARDQAWGERCAKIRSQHHFGRSNEPIRPEDRSRPADRRPHLRDYSIGDASCGRPPSVRFRSLSVACSTAPGH